MVRRITPQKSPAAAGLFVAICSDHGTKGRAGVAASVTMTCVTSPRIILRFMPTDILLVSMARALVEVAGMLLVGQGMLWIFGPRARDGNFVYDLFKKGTGPIIRVTRHITPRFVHDAHIGLVAFMLLLWIWLALGFAKRYLCVTQQVNCV
jgi:hypothetical protein